MAAATDMPEERFARKLASNDLPVRNRALKRLKKWIQGRSALQDGFTEMELLKLWKGLHVCMWHSDKPLVQAELAESIANLLYNFEIPERGLEFVSAFFTTVAREWLGIDRLRLDKYYTLIRKMVKHSFRFLQQNQWNEGLVLQLVDLLSSGPLNKDFVKACLGVQLHVVEVFLPELLLVCAPAKGKGEGLGGEGVGREGRCPTEQLLAPAFSLLAGTTNSSVIECLEANILRQIEKESVIKKLQIDCEVVSERLRALAIDRSTVGRNRKRLYDLCKRFSDDSNLPSPVALDAIDHAPQPQPRARQDLEPPPRKKMRKVKTMKKMKRLIKKQKRKL